MNDLYVGQTVRMSHVFSEQDVLDFARISGDGNPIHIDASYASGTRFGERIIHGLLVAGMISKILGTILPGNGSIYTSQTLKFIRPAYINQVLTAKVEIKEIDKKKIVLDTNVFNDKKEIIISGEATVLYEGS